MNKKCDKNNKPIITQKMKALNKTLVWKTITNNPNIYCWLPVSKKNVLPSTITLSEANIQDIPPPHRGTDEEFAYKIDELSNLAEETRNKLLLKKLKEGRTIVSADDPKKYTIVKQFIKDKKLKLYGGAAINMYIPRKDKFYKPASIPDYDFYSSDPWNDAIELANKLYKAGYLYTEVRAGIHKGTYKVFSNMWPVADITYMPNDDFKKIKTKTIQGIKIISPGQLMTDIYKQLADPSGDPSRWFKVATRARLLKKWVNPLGKNYTCSGDIFTGGKKYLNDERTFLLEVASKFIRNNKLIHFGNLAYNTFLEVAGGIERLTVEHYEVLSTNAKQDVDKLFHLMVKLTQNKLNLNIKTQYLASKSINNTYYHIIADQDIICTIVDQDFCTPAKYIFGRWICSVDYLKYELYYKFVFGDEKQIKNEKCKINYLNNLQNNYYETKNVDEFTDTPFQRFLTKCKGNITNTLKETFLERWIDKIERNEKVTVIKPKKKSINLCGVKGTTIKIYPRSATSECFGKKENECRYPCSWNKNMKKCFPIPSGTYMAGVDNIKTSQQAD
jgi:hypothetical protein